MFKGEYMQAHREPPETVQEQEIGFAELRLRPGTVLYIQRDAIGAPLTEIHYLGSVADKIIMVTQKIESKSKTLLKLGENYILHGFSGQYDFSFTTQTVELHKTPFPYASLAFPPSVHAKMVRKLARVRTFLPASIVSLSSDAVTSATLIDLTVAGALIESATAIGKTGESVHITSNVDLGNEKKELALLADIRHVHQTGSGGYNIGVEFKELSQADKLVLHYLVHEWADKETQTGS
jgi:hypothetical protein